MSASVVTKRFSNVRLGEEAFEIETHKSKSPALLLKSAGVDIFCTGPGFRCIFSDNDRSCKIKCLSFQVDAMLLCSLIPCVHLEETFYTMG